MQLWRGRITEALRTLITLRGFSDSADLCIVYELYGLTGEKIGVAEGLDHE
jgi:hypothetical protein